MADRPSNIGIKAIELYFPSQCVDQAELEKFDGVSAGKYTIGLGQTKMSFCDDREDMYSLALTALSSLLAKYSIDPKTVGRLEVGTETMLDKSKSVKSVLMQLFDESANYNVEGVDTVNACYGGTNALFNTLNWLESAAWDGRDGIVVTGDIALYKKGNARPTGGAGCVAMLIGPDAPLVFEPGLRGTYIKHAYDFYKPDLTSEYPYVDGHFSIKCYTEAVDRCYQAYTAREAQLAARAAAATTTNGAATNGVNGVNGHAAAAAAVETPLDRFDYMCFHAPTCKLVAKSYARLLYNDYLADPAKPLFADVPASLRQLDRDASIADRAVEKTFLALAAKRFGRRVQPTVEAPTMCGNMYCASVYSSLCSLVANVPAEELRGKRVAVFSYGSGLASSMFSLRVRGCTREMRDRLDLKNRLAARRTVEPQVYDDMCNLREKAHLKKSYTPAGNPDTLFPGTYYLTEIDDQFRRKYAVKTG